MNTAILVLDIQKGFIGQKARMPAAAHQIEPMLENVNDIVEKADHKKIPVVYIGNEYEPKQFMANFLTKKSALKGSEGAELDERLLRVKDCYFSKSKSSALSNPELVAYLTANRIKHLVIVGLFAEACVAATALDSIHRQFTAAVVKDAIASMSDARKEKSLKYMCSKGVAIVESSQLFQNSFMENLG
ncbi:cysteine hydrolase family protein [Metabacillus sp. JX24]|uniref:cysteine hydrolase family protein n=1 Tax=Metabacillus sp. JX24 TaxID=3240759 RepID=UPI0035102E10